VGDITNLFNEKIWKISLSGLLEGYGGRGYSYKRGYPHRWWGLTH
jgi:hypothetical protein